MMKHILLLLLAVSLTFATAAQTDSNRAELSKMTVPQYIEQGSTGGRVSVTITNTGIKQLLSFCVRITIDGQEGSGPVHVTGLDSRNLTNGKAYRFSIGYPLPSTDLGYHTAEITLTNINDNGDTASILSQLSESYYVYDPAITVPRTTLIEQFTGYSCPNCPPGEERMKNATRTYKDIIWITHHAGYGNDPLNSTASQAATFFFNNDGSTYAPAYMYNRYQVNQNNPGPVTHVYTSPTDIRAEINVARNLPAFVTLGFTDVAFDTATRHYVGHISGRFLSMAPYTRSTRVMLYLVEDSINMRQADNSSGSAIWISPYYHMRTVREAPFGTWGKTFAVDEEGYFNIAFDEEMSADYDYTQCRLVAFLYKYHSTNANDCTVLQSATTGNLNHPKLSIDRVGSDIHLDFYPNPATTAIHLQSDEGMTLVQLIDMRGREVIHSRPADALSTSISTHNVAAGIYLLRITTATGVTTKRITVTH
ncbi:MAG: T9SS type A sorting domain-containing protein [Bacteroidales bacterium]|nr:T9SS type A sorting domain-containing protein [Bacteroidales bacterium]